MIFKELDPFVAQSKFDRAGRKAEEQMAHYLLRFFGKSESVDCLNGVRIELDGEIAQMDHIVLHPYGVLIVESKSVAGSVQIKDDGQWIRWSINNEQKKASGMRSPITQAQMQCSLLKELLTESVKNKAAFDNVRFDVIVAISDNGTIQWPSTGALPEVCKADQVPGKVQTLIQSLQTTPPILSSENRKRIAEFLMKKHRPVLQIEPEETATVAPVPAPTPAASPTQTPSTASGKLPNKACKHCASDNLELSYGKFGYYFQCKACTKNTPLRFDCPECGEEGKLRKSGKEFFAECRSCTASVPFFTNL